MTADGARRLTRDELAFHAANAHAGRWPCLVCGVYTAHVVGFLVSCVDDRWPCLYALCRPCVEHVRPEGIELELERRGRWAA